MLRAMLRRVRNGSVRILDQHLSGETLNFRQVIAIIVPLLVDQAFIVLLSLMNTAMVSSSGDTAVAAVSMVDSLNIFLLNVFIALATGGTVIVAQYKGAENPKAVSKAAAQAISAVIIASLVICALVVGFHKPVLRVLFGKAEQAVFDNARLYLIGSGITYPLIAVVESVCGALRGAGETKASLWLSLIKNGTYVLFNILFISILHMGILGLVVSLLISRIIGMVCSLVYIIKINKVLNFRVGDMFHLDFSMLRRILFIGIPFAAEQLFFNGGKLLTQTFIVELGTNALAINAISASIVTVFQAGGVACSLAVVTVVGQCVGRGNIRDARKFVRSFLVLGSLFLLVTEVLFLPFFAPLVGLFSPRPEIVPTIYAAMWMTCATAPLLWPMSFVIPSALRAAGDSRFTSLTSMLTMWLLRVVLGYILGVVLPFGILGVWAAMIIEWGIRSIIFQLRLHGDRWHRHHLLD